MSKQLIYCCLFGSDEYMNLCKIFLQSIDNYGKINNTDVVIITTEYFKNNLQNFINSLSIPIYFYIKDNVDYFSRLSIFSYKNIDIYSKLLYIDLDCVIINSIQPIFDLIVDDKLYCKKEVDNIGTQSFNAHGMELFCRHNCNYNVPGFSSGIMAFCNTVNIINLFNQTINHIETDISNNRFVLCLHDQGYIVFNTYKNNLVECTSINNFIANNEIENKNKIIIYHMSGNMGNGQVKLSNMNAFINNL